MSTNDIIEILNEKNLIIPLFGIACVIIGMMIGMEL